MPPKTGGGAVAAVAAASAGKAALEAQVATLPLVAPRCRTETKDGGEPKGPPGVCWPPLLRFLFPPGAERPESTGRLELFARYGPVDEDGSLRGGIRGTHVHSEFEIRQMIKHETKEALLVVLKKPRATAEVIVEGVLPRALEQVYTQAEVRAMLTGVPLDRRGEMKFADLQVVILESRRNRLKALLRDGALSSRGGNTTPRVPFQSKAAQILMQGLDTRKLNFQEENLLKQKRLANYASLLSNLEDQNQSNTLIANTTLMRSLGDVDDRWDRYCAVRRAGRSSYVQARNAPRTPRDGSTYVGDELADRHPGTSSLVAASAMA